ncbi:MAG: N-acetylneuraminate synthase family protein [Pseudomonadota bacterium]
MTFEPDSLIVVAEAAQGYEGNAGLAHALIRAAASAGADALKLQLVYADELCTPDYKYQQLFRSLEMADGTWREIAEHARQRGIHLMLDVFGPRSLNVAVEIGAVAVKIHSTDMVNVGLLQEVASSPAPLVLLSTGGCSRDEISEALGILGEKDLVLLHGYQGYPTPLKANHIGRLRALRAIAAETRCSVPARLGFADHVPSDDPLRFTLAATALGLGASVLEKHITLAHVMKMEDHESALNPDEFATFANNMRQCYQAMDPGSVDAPDFGMDESERSYRENTRKHVVALRPIPAETVISPGAVGLKRTSAKSFLTDTREVYGKQVGRDIATDTAVTREMLKGDA